MFRTAHAHSCEDKSAEKETFLKTVHEDPPMGAIKVLRSDENIFVDKENKKKD